MIQTKIIKVVADVGVKVAKTIAVKVADSLAKQGADVVVKKVVSPKRKINIPSSAINYYHRNYKEVKLELLAYGFTDIRLVERKDLVVGVLTKPDSIEEISINGKADFQKNQRFSSDSRIVIIYHSFKD